LQYKLASAVGKKGLLVRKTSVISPRYKLYDSLDAQYHV
jgi:hypothetical protein